MVVPAAANAPRHQPIDRRAIQQVLSRRMGRSGPSGPQADRFAALEIARGRRWSRNGARPADVLRPNRYVRTIDRTVAQRSAFADDEPRLFCKTSKSLSPTVPFSSKSPTIVSDPVAPLTDKT